MQRDANILPLDVRMEKICSRFAMQAIRNVSPRNSIRRQANSDRPEETDLEQLFTKIKQMEGIDDNIYWSKRPPWKRPRYNRTRKAYATTRKLKSAVWTESKQKRQKDYEKPGNFVQYYFSTQRKRYGKGYFNPLKDFMATASRHTLRNLFYLRRGHVALGNFFKKMFIAERITNVNRVN
jgi:hypothetical protein